MNNLLKRTRDVILTRQSGIISSSIVIAGMMMVARVFGFARYRVLNGYFTTDELDVFYSAFRVPDFVFEILITGALTTTFIPFYLKFSKDKRNQSQFTSTLINLITVFLIVFIGILYVFMPTITAIITPGFSQQKLDKIVYLSRMLLIWQMPFLVFGNILTGLAQANKMFLLPAIAPVLYNVVIVAVIFVFAPTVGINSALFGVIVGALLLFLSQIVVVGQVGFRYSFTVKYLSEIAQFVKQVVPRIMTVLGAQIEATIDLTLASLLAHGSYTIFYLAQHIQLLPVSIVGISIGQASLPYLTEMYQERKFVDLRNVINDSINNILFLTIPVAGFFIVNRTATVRLVYGASQFDWSATVMTAVTMSYFCLSIPFHSVYYLITRCFYATMDSKTPFLVSLVSIALNTILSYVAIWHLKAPVWALGATFSFTISLQVIVLTLILSTRIRGLLTKSSFFEITKVAVASLLATIVAYDTRKLLDGLIFDSTRTLNLFLLMVVTFVVMFATYFFAVWALESRGLFLLYRVFTNIKNMPKKITTFFTPVEA
jgi:putative peptidoglycan lipid II flippase